MMVEWLLGGLSTLLIMCSVWIVKAINSGSRRIADAIKAHTKAMTKKQTEDPVADALGVRLKEIQTGRMAPPIIRTPHKV